MLSEKCDLLEQINVHLDKKWNIKNSSVTSIPLEQKPKKKKKKKNHRIAVNSYLSNYKNDNSIGRLEQRVKYLEYRNEQLIHLLNALIENLPELIASGLHPEQEAQSSFNNQSCLFDTDSPDCNRDREGEEVQTLNCCEKDKSPCPTRRERDIIDLLVKGFCAKEIANRLFISETTVVTHKKNLKEKFSAKNSVELISKVQHFLLKEKEEK